MHCGKWTRRWADPPTSAQPTRLPHRIGAAKLSKKDMKRSNPPVNVVNAGTPQQVALSRPSPVPARTAVPANGPGASPSPQPGVLKTQPVQRDICTGEGSQIVSIPAPTSSSSRAARLASPAHLCGDIFQVSTSALRGFASRQKMLPNPGVPLISHHFTPSSNCGHHQSNLYKLLRNPPQCRW